MTTTASSLILEPGTVEAPCTDAGQVPVTVVARMGEPVVHHRDGLSLDGPLAWATWMQHASRHGHTSLPPIDHADWATDFALPLARWAVPADDLDTIHPGLLDASERFVWGWCASHADGTQWTLDGTVWIRRKPAIEQMARWSDAAKHHIGGGPLKARNVPMATVFAPEIRWWLVGDPDELAPLLDRITHIGSLTKQGHGRVLDWHVSDDPSDSARTNWTAGTPKISPGSPVRRGVRPPYHHHSRQVPCL